MHESVTLFGVRLTLLCLMAVLVARPAVWAQQPETPSVAMRSNTFQPTTLTIEVGQTVTWVNEDSVPHSVVADNGSFTSSYLNQSQRFSHTFEQAGSFSYYCDLHQGMDGTINVTVQPLSPRAFLPLVAGDVGSP